MARKTDVKSIFDTLSSKSPDQPDFTAGDVASMCTSLLQLAPEEVFDWAFSEVKRRLCSEVVLLSEARYGLHFNMANATSDYLEGSFMQVASEKMRTNTPRLWDVIVSLLDANPDRRRVKPDFSGRQDSVIEKLSSNQEDDLGEIGGLGDVPMDADSATDVENEDDDFNGLDEKAGKPRKSTRRAAERNAALIMIVSTLHYM